MLVNGGFSVWSAAVANIISASTSYVGFVIGALLGEIAEVHPWFFSVAGGMFLYIALADMLAEMSIEGMLLYRILCFMFISKFQFIFTFFIVKQP